ncbi:MAG: hypothetical protein LAT81_08830 [Oceanicaulis sp.]|nr:hypothetical protein [Oceanicaulis sp.]
MNEIDEIEGHELEIIENYIENGRVGTLPEELLQYLDHLEIIRGLHHRNKSRQFIIHFLTGEPYNLSPYLARKRFADSMNLFYLDTSVRKESWRNIYAEKLEKAAIAALEMMKTVKDLDVYKNLLVAAANMRQLEKDDPEELPKELFEKPFKVYTSDVELFVDMPKTDRKLLAEMIDNYDISEMDKKRLREESAIDTPKLRLDEQSTQKDT